MSRRWRRHVFLPPDLAAARPPFVPCLRATRRFLNAREKTGKVRRCHGDLHLRNICLVDGAPTLFDCIEFDETLATIDVLYDLAFLHYGPMASRPKVERKYCDESVSR